MEGQRAQGFLEGARRATCGPKGRGRTCSIRAREFKNFELEVEVLAQPGCNSGVYFHTAYQETGFPIKGFEIQINNTATGEGTYRERKKTGSLYGVRNVYKQLVQDDQWFKLARRRCAARTCRSG